MASAEMMYSLPTSSFLHGLAELRNQRLLCDVDLVAEDETFPVHRVVLAAASPYFQAMFTGGFKESGQNTIHLKGASQEGLAKVLDSICSSEIKLTKENLENVLSVATLLAMGDIVKVCETFFLTTLRRITF